MSFYNITKEEKVNLCNLELQLFTWLGQLHLKFSLLGWGFAFLFYFKKIIIHWFFCLVPPSSPELFWFFFLPIETEAF